MKFKHGRSGTPEFTAWTKIQQNCYNPNAKGYKTNGALGIVVCDAWLEDFMAFFRDMGRRPPGTVLTRLNPKGNYEACNCVWMDVNEAKAISLSKAQKARKGTRKGSEVDFPCGHPRSEENTRVSMRKNKKEGGDKIPHRMCRQCGLERSRKARLRRGKDYANSYAREWRARKKAEKQ